MKKLFVLLLVISTSAFSAEKLPMDMYCDDTKTIVKALSIDYQEVPFIIGKTSDLAGSIMTFWVNPETKTWSIIATKDNISCVVGAGEKAELISSNRKSKTIKYY